MPGVMIKIEMDQKSVTRLNTALTTLGDKDAPFLRNTIDRLGQLLTHEVQGHAKGGIATATSYTGVKGSGGGVRAGGIVRHKGARRMEFGRDPKPYKGNASIRGYSYKGQRAVPYLGVIKGNAAIGAVRPQAKPALQKAFADEWERLGT